MKLNSSQTAGSLAALIDAKVVGDPDTVVTGINEIHVVEPGDLVFTDHPKYYKKTLQSEASVVLINQTTVPPTGKALLVSDDPFRDFKKLIAEFSSWSPQAEAINTAAKIGEGTLIQPGAFLGNNVTIGKNCIIHPNVTLCDNTQIGDNVIIHANTVIGGDAFYYKNRETGFDKLTSCGAVVIEDDVEIGTCCTIDRGVTGDTKIGRGTKIDNQVHIGHDCVVGEDCLMAAQVGVAGCVVMGDRVTLWGQVGVAANIVIEDGVTVYAQGGVGKNLKAEGTYFGSPADVAMRKFREMAALRQLPNIIENL